MKEKIINSIKNYEKALSKLIEYTNEPVKTDRDRSGVIQAFEFTFELAWKTFKKSADFEGLNVAGPRDSLKQAFKLNFIQKDKEEQQWIEMLKHRNLTTHTYQENMSNDIFNAINLSYKDLLTKSLNRLKDKYQ